MKQSIDWRGETNASAGGIQKHNDRIKDHFEANKNIDASKTKDNVTFVASSINADAKKINSKKISGGLQKKSLTFTNFVIHGSKELTREQNIRYFEESIKWTEEYFKVKISHAVGHFDETTPHLHLSFSNLREIDGKWFCSMSKVLGTSGLKASEVQKRGKQISQDFWNEVSKDFGFDKPMPSGRGKVDMLTFQAEQEAKKLEEASKAKQAKEMELGFTSQKLDRVKKEFKNLNDSLNQAYFFLEAHALPEEKIILAARASAIEVLNEIGQKGLAQSLGAEIITEAKKKGWSR